MSSMQSDYSQSDRFRNILRASRKVKTSLLPVGEKLVLEEILDQITFEPLETHEKFYRLMTGRIQANCGGLQKTENLIGKLLLKGLIEQEGREHLPDELWLAIPDDIFARFKKLTPNNWGKFPRCRACGYQGMPTVEMFGHKVIRCGQCKAIQTEYDFDMEYRNGKKTRDEKSNFHQPYYPVSTKLQKNAPKIVPTPEEWEAWEIDTEMTYSSEEIDNTALAVEEPTRNDKAKELLEQARLNGWRITTSNSSGQLVLGTRKDATQEEWQRARNALRPYDTEIIALLKREAENEEKSA